MTGAAPGHDRAHGIPWAEARALAGQVERSAVTEVPLRAAVGAVLASDATASGPVPHFDSSAMDGWAVAGPPPWRITDEDLLVPGQARAIVTGGLLPLGAQAVVPLERASRIGALLDAQAAAPGAHVRRAGEEATAGTVLVPAGTRLSPADVAVLSIAGLDVVPARTRPRLGLVLTGDEVVTSGRPAPGRVRDAFDPLLPLAAARLGADPLPAVRVGDDPAAIRDALASVADADLLVTVGGTGRSGVDRLRDALGGAATTAFDGVAMRPGHPALLVRLPDGRPLLGLPGNPLAAVAALLSFLPPLLDARTGAAPRDPSVAVAATDLPGWAGGVSLLPCRTTPEGVVPCAAARPNMLRGLAAADLLAVVPAEGAPAGGPVPVLPLPW